MQGQTLSSFKKEPIRETHVAAFKAKNLVLSPMQDHIVKYLTDQNNWVLPGPAKLADIFNISRTSAGFHLETIKKRSENTSIPDYLRSKLTETN